MAIDVPVRDAGAPMPEHRLYQLLAETYGDGAHGRYNALIRKLVGFTRAVACVR